MLRSALSAKARSGNLSSILERDRGHSPGNVVASVIEEGSIGLPRRRRAVSRRLRDWLTAHKRSFYLTALLLDLVYVALTVPLRLAFFFDPYASTRVKRKATEGLYVFGVLDLLTDAVSVANLFEIFNSRRQAQLAAASAVAAAMPQTARKLEMAPCERKRSDVKRSSSYYVEMKRSLAVMWSVNELFPAAANRLNISRPLVLEIIALLPLELFAISLGVNAIHALCALKVFRLYRLQQCVDEIKQRNAHRNLIRKLQFTGTRLLLRAGVLGVMLCHLIACVYMWLAHWQCGLDLDMCGVDAHRARMLSAVQNQPSPSGKTCWAIQDQLVGAETPRKYARAIYWAARSVITLGYSDVAPITNIETLYAILVQIIGALFTTHLVATFLLVLRFLNSRKQEFLTVVDNANEYMKMSQIPKNVRDAVLSYYQDLWRSQRGLPHDFVIKHLPDHFRLAVNKVLIGKLLNDVSFFAHESAELLNTLALNIEHWTYSPKDWIIEKESDGMYFVLRGNVRLEARDQAQSRDAKVGDHFAEAALLYEGTTDIKARAQTFCELKKLTRRKFRDVMGVFYRGRVDEVMQVMRNRLAKQDHQQEKMKKMLGQTMTEIDRSTMRGDRGSWVSIRRLSGSKSSTGRPQWRMPGSTFRSWWEHAHLVCLIFVAYEVPFHFVFETNAFPFGDATRNIPQSVIAAIVEVFFMADFAFCARFFIFMDPLSLIPVADASLIFARYKKHQMWLDLIAIEPVALVLEFTLGKRWMIGPSLRLLRLLRLHKFPSVIQDVAALRNLSSKMQRALALGIAVTLSIHLVGCLWVLMGRLTLPDDPESLRGFATTSRQSCLRDATQFANCSWVIVDAYEQIGCGFVAASPDSKYTTMFAYTRSIYWAIVALTTVGYGDIVAYSTEESLFAALWAFFGGIINFGVCAAMSHIISNMSASRRLHLDRMNHINRVLAHYNITNEVRAQVRRHYHQLRVMQRAASEATLLDRLPQQLRYRISEILHSDSVTKIDLLTDHGNTSLIQAVTGLFRRAVFQRGELLVPDSAICNDLLVVVAGRANVFYPGIKSVPIGVLYPGSCHGVNEFILRLHCSTLVVAATIVEVSIMTHESFATIVRSHYTSELPALRGKAQREYDRETRSMDAIVCNLRCHQKLQKDALGCTSMFCDSEALRGRENKAPWQMLFELVFLVAGVYNSVMVPFRLAFLQSAHTSDHTSMVLIDFAMDAMLWLYVLLQLYYFECEGGLSNLWFRSVRNANYAQHELTFDLWSLLPLYYVGDSFSIVSLCRIPRLLFVRQLPQVFDSMLARLQQQFLSHGNLAAAMSPVKLGFVLLLAAHVAAGIFYWISTEDSNDHSWLHHDHILLHSHGSVFVRYLRAIYWALSTLTLGASRDIVPLDLWGTLFAVATCLCCTFVVGHIIGELSELTLEMDKSKKALHERERFFEQFAKDQSLPATLHRRIQHFLKYQHEHTNGLDVATTFCDLPRMLRETLMMDLHREVLTNVSIATMLSERQLRIIAISLESELFIPGDRILVEGEPGHKLCVLKSGAATVIWQPTGTVVTSIERHSLFGEVAFFVRAVNRIATVQAWACCEILTLGRRAWDEMLSASTREERNKTERMILEHICDRLRGYSTMAQDIIRDLTSSGMRVSTKHGEKSATPHADRERALRLLVGRSWPSTLSTRRSNLSKQSGVSGGRSSLTAAVWGNVFGPRGRNKVYATMNPTSSATLSSKATATTCGRRSLANPPLLRGASHLTGFAGQSKQSRFNIHDLYSPKQLKDMEQECWRRCKAALLLAEALASSTARRELQWMGLVRIARIDGIDDSSLPVHSRNATDQVDRGESPTVRITTKHASLHQIVPSPPPRKLPNPINTDAEDQMDPSHACEARHLIKRAHSLPRLDAICAQAAAVEIINASAQSYDEKLDLGYEALRRVRLPEFSFSFKIYTRWRRVKRRWNGRRLIVSAAVSLVDQTCERKPRQEVSTCTFPHLLTKERSIARNRSENDVVGFFRILSRWYSLWKLLIVQISSVYMILVPFFFSFGSLIPNKLTPAAESRLSAIVGVCDALCVLDFALSYTLFQGIGQVENEQEVSRASRHKPASQVAIDLFGMAPFAVLLDFGWVDVSTHYKWIVMGLLESNKLVLAHSIRKHVGEHLDHFLANSRLPLQESTLRFQQALMQFTLAGHWIACVWFHASLKGWEEFDLSWISRPFMLAEGAFTSLDDISIDRMYLRATHFATGAISTVCYGDILSSNVAEALAELSVIIASIFVFGLLVGAQSQYLEATYKRRMQYEQNLAELFFYLRSHNVPRELRHRIRLHYVNTWIKFRGYDDLEGVRGVSTLLLQETAQATLHQLTTKVKIFRNCEEYFLRALLVGLKHLVCSPNELVVSQGDVDRNMYFIATGRILICAGNFQILKRDGDFFGELSLLYGIPRSATCSSVVTSLLYVLTWEAYENVLRDFPEYRQRNRRDWVLANAELSAGDARFCSSIDLISKLEQMNNIQVAEVIDTAKRLTAPAK